MEQIDQIHRYFKAWNARDADVILSTLGDGGTYQDPSTGVPISGDALRAYVAGLWSAFPDLTFEEESIGEMGPDRVAAQWVMRGTNTGSMMGLSPTGKRVELRGADFFTLKNGKIQSVNGYFDKGEVTRQIGVASLTAEELKGYKQALSDFRNILIALVEEVREEKKSDSPRILAGSTRNPIVWLNRYLNRVPEFEELVAKYTNILPTLETDDGIPYSKMALIGIKALQRRKLEIAKTVYSELLFKTTGSAKLGSTLGGVVVSIAILIILGLILVAIAERFGIPIDNTDAIHLFVAFCSGCFGSVISFLGRLSDFDSKQVRSQRFLFAYGLTLPIIGGGFALVLAAALGAGVIKILDNGVQLFIVIGFLAGFSERFTKSILEMVSGKIVPQGAQK